MVAELTNITLGNNLNFNCLGLVNCAEILERERERERERES